VRAARLHVQASRLHYEGSGRWERDARPALFPDPFCLLPAYNKRETAKRAALTLHCSLPLPRFLGDSCT